VVKLLVEQDHPQEVLVDELLVQVVLEVVPQQRRVQPQEVVLSLQEVFVVSLHGHSNE
jgi:hypothetical protein